MNKHLSSRLSLPFALGLIVAGVVLGSLGAYGLTRLASRGEIMGRVQVAGIPIGGLGREEALTTLVAIEDEFGNRSAVFLIEGNPVTIDAAETGLVIDSEGMVEVAMSIGREGGPIDQFRWWLGHIFATTEVPVLGGTDRSAVDDLLDAWDAEVIADPAVPGGVVLTDGIPQPVYPAAGTGVDRPRARELILSTLLAVQPEPAVIPTTIIQPKLTDADIDAAVAEAAKMLSGPVRLVHNGTEALFSVAVLSDAFRSETITESTPQVVNFFDPEVVDGFLDPIRAEFEAEPVDARFEIQGDFVVVIPGQKGTAIDPEETARRLAAASLTSERIGQLPLVEAADPEITTEYLESLGIKHLVSEFTTYHSCCEARVVNIQTMAATLDGTIVLPGDTFSLNEFIGERTAEKGYLPAGTIIAGELEDTVGGGVSQFTTTMYNAVFWGGYEDVEHKAHSYYFSRYPEGIEATLNWRTPDLKFRNNRDHAVLIDTAWTDNSITVRFFGDNDGRIVKGEQSGGSTHLHVVAPGGPNALHVEGIVSERFGFTSPPPPRYVPNPALAIDQQVETQEADGGWSVTVTRRILRGGVQLIEETQWVVRYAPKFAVIEVHPCMMPGATEPCPTTTTQGTTTTQPTSTS